MFEFFARGGATKRFASLGVVEVGHAAALLALVRVLEEEVAVALVVPHFQK